MYLRKSKLARVRPLLALNGPYLALLLGLLAVAAAIVQLIIGASIDVVGFALVATAAGLFGFVVLGAYNLAAWLALFYTLGNVLVALYAKTLLGQPLDSFLYAPLNSFVALAITSTGLLAALLLVRHVRLGRPLFRGVSDPRFLSFLSWVCFGLGGIFWLLNRSFQDPTGSGFGGIALFRDLLLMSVIARTAMLLEKSQYRRAFDGRLGLVIAISVFFGLIDNQKTMMALPVVSHFVTVLFYRRGMSLRSMAVLLIGAIIFVSVLGPAIHAFRVMGQSGMNMAQRIELVVSNAAIVVESPQSFDRLQRIAAGQFGKGYYDYFGEAGAGQMVLGRFASVQQIDPVIAAVDRGKTRGGSAIWPALGRLLPSFLYRDKAQYGESYHTLVYYGLINPASGKYPTLPLAGQVYASYGFVGLFFIPFLTFLGFCLLVKKLGWHLQQNVYAIFFFCDFVIVYASQGDFGQYAAATLRNFPLFAIVFWLIAQAYRPWIRQPRYRSRAQLRSECC